ncbi:porin, partial [Pararhodospirillum oryzae]|uniref:porin n=1 Tax=Pararhodospirillum oryzae TaxID=478448 RepID=UPI0011BEDCCA
SAMIQFEAEANENGNRNVDEQWVDVSGSFGSLRLGEKEGVMDRFAVRAPLADDFLGWIQPQDAVVWMKDPTAAATFVTLDTRPTDDSLRISYVTPSFYGVQAGVSYAPKPGAGLGGRAGAGVPNGDVNRDEVQAGLSLNTEFSGVKVMADGSFATEVDDNDDWMYRGGLGFQYAGFTLSGGYFGRSGEDVANEFSVWEAGLHYASGPYGVGFVYAQNDTESGTSRTVYELGGNYTMGPGVNLVGALFYADADADTGAANDNRDGIGAVTGLVLAF